MTMPHSAAPTLKSTGFLGTSLGRLFVVGLTEKWVGVCDGVSR